MIEVRPGIFTLLSEREVKELKRCIAIAYRPEQRRRQFETLACQPEAARRFVKHPHFHVERQEPLDLN